MFQFYERMILWICFCPFALIFIAGKSNTGAWLIMQFTWVSILVIFCIEARKELKLY